MLSQLFTVALLAASAAGSPVSIDPNDIETSVIQITTDFLPAAEPTTVAEPSLPEVITTEVIQVTTLFPTTTTRATASTTSTRRPRVTDPNAPRTCILIDGPNPVIIDPFKRADCVCDCYKVACKTLNQGGSSEDYEKCIVKYFGPNPVNFDIDMIAAFGACTGSRRCIG